MSERFAARVRPLAHADVAAAAAIVAEGTLSAGVEHPERVDDYWAAACATRECGGDVLVVEQDGEVVGLCQVLVFWHFQHTGGRCAELESVYVRADRRGRGLGGLLLEGAEALARERGCYRVQLTSRHVRVDAHRFYRAHGYLATSEGFKKSLIGEDLT